jgi:hypothetical protein
VACYNRSPTDNKNQSPGSWGNDAVIPPLNKWSDVVGLQWIQLVRNNVSPLSYIIRSGIANAKTLNMIKEAFTLMGQDKLLDGLGMTLRQQTLPLTLLAQASTLKLRPLGALAPITRPGRPIYWRSTGHYSVRNTSARSESGAIKVLGLLVKGVYKASPQTCSCTSDVPA